MAVIQELFRDGMLSLRLEKSDAADVYYIAAMCENPGNELRGAPSGMWFILCTDHRSIPSIVDALQRGGKLLENNKPKPVK